MGPDQPSFLVQGYFANIKPIPEEAVLLWKRIFPDTVTLELIALMEILFPVKVQSVIVRVDP